MDFVVFLSNFFFELFFSSTGGGATKTKTKSVSEFFALGTQNPRDARERERRKEARLFLLDRAKARREASPCLVQS